MKDITIRTMDVNDAPFINRLKIMADVFENTLNNPCESIEETYYWIKNKGIFDCYFVCEIASLKKIVGYVILERDTNPRLQHIVNLRVAVDSKYHNKKIGTKLLNYAIDYCNNWLPVSKIELSVTSHNTFVRKWYKKNGFFEEGIKKKNLLINGHYSDVVMMGMFLKEKE